MTTEYLKWQDPEYQRLLARRTSCESSIQNYQYDIRSSNVYLSKAEQCYKLLVNAADNIQDTELLSFFSDHHITDAHRALRNAEIQITEYEESISRLMDRISQLNEQLSTMPNGEKQVHIPSAKSRLKSYPGVDSRSLSFGSDYKGPYMRWTTSGIKMRPDQCIHQWILPKGDIPVIPIQPVVTKVYLHDASVIMGCKRGQSAWCTYLFSGRKKNPHPHILSNGKPCLGDFQAPLAEAIHEQDFQTVVTIIKLFLERAVAMDPAGANWISYFKSFLPYGSFLGGYFITPYEKYQVVEREELGFYDFHKYSNAGALISIDPHPYNGLF